MDYEVEQYDAATGTLVAWVRLPLLEFDADTVFYLAYGNSSINSSQQNVSGVWDTNYKMVQHLNDDPSGAAPQSVAATPPSMSVSVS